MLNLSFGLLWCLTIHDTPEDNNRVSKGELTYIQLNIIENENIDDVVSKCPPYLAIARSKKVWALVSCQFSVLICGVPLDQVSSSIF